jgi:hypothetical protein
VSDGLKIGSLELFADYSTSGYRFTVRQGGLQSLPTYRGEDDVVPGAAGRAPGAFVATGLDVELHGIVEGAGADAEATRGSFAQRMAALLALVHSDELVTMTAYPPLFGLAIGEVATLADVRPLRLLGPDPAELEWYQAWEGSIQLESIATDPRWSVVALSYLVTGAGDPLVTPAGDRLYVIS